VLSALIVALVHSTAYREVGRVRIDKDLLVDIELNQHRRRCERDFQSVKGFIGFGGLNEL
jgi:hypothetical protein